MEEEVEDETMMFEIVFKSGKTLSCELPLDEVPSTKEELTLVRTTSPIAYWTGVILDWRDISGCAPDYSNV